jgi:hypothetical protein
MADTTFKEQVAALLENIPVVLVVGGLLLFALGSVGGITYKEILVVPDTVGRVSLIVGGLVLLAMGLWLRGQCKPLQAKAYGIKITSVRDNDRLDKKASFRGSFSKTPPQDYEIFIVRIYPNDGSYYPMHTASINSDKTWQTIDCDLGGNPGDTRIIAVCLAGVSSRAFFDYFKMAEASHGKALDLMRKANVTGGGYLPVIPKGLRPTDLIECHRVTIIRK